MATSAIPTAMLARRRRESRPTTLVVASPSVGCSCPSIAATTIAPQAGHGPQPRADPAWRNRRSAAEVCLAHLFVLEEGRRLARADDPPGLEHVAASRDAE